jgi:hypothetical protein
MKTAGSPDAGWRSSDPQALNDENHLTCPGFPRIDCPVPTTRPRGPFPCPPDALCVSFRKLRQPPFTSQESQGKSNRACMESPTAARVLNPTQSHKPHTYTHLTTLQYLSQFVDKILSQATQADKFNCVHVFLCTHQVRRKS